LTVQIDHINGVRDDHRLENLRMLCPNCHSQTATYGQRNRSRDLQEPAPVV
jgi:5-methylcytosine-specific restriction endonuclease McrA